jgi:hypothetical protein
MWPVRERRRQREPAAAVACAPTWALRSVLARSAPARNLVRRIAVGVVGSANPLAQWFVRLGARAPTWVPVFASLSPL